MVQQQLKKLAAKSRPLRKKGDFAVITIMKNDKFRKKVALLEAALVGGALHLDMLPAVDLLQLSVIDN